MSDTRSSSTTPSRSPSSAPSSSSSSGPLAGGASGASASPTPAAQGYSMPPEWAPHEGTWISWPHNERNWPGRFEAVPDVFAQMVKALAPGERVHINAGDDALEASARRVLEKHDALSDQVVFHRIPTNDPWMRDCGPIILTHPDPAKPRLALHWGYNAWGGKYPPYDQDILVASRAAADLGLSVIKPDMILEGGSIEVNGQGLLLTTESVLLNPNRNPDLGREEIERRIRAYLGVSKILWLGDGIVGDDTDGHIDDLTRFVAPDTVVTVVEDDPDDENHEALQQNLERLRGMTGLDGRPLTILSLPMPDAVVCEDQRLPASYANFYIGNRVVLLPVYDCPEKDERARAVLADCFPGREIVPIRCVDLIWGLGAFHCLTQQIPA